LLRNTKKSGGDKMPDIAEIGKHILKEIMHLEGPTVDNPEVENTPFGCRMRAGSITLHLYDVGHDEAGEAFAGDASASEYLGKGDGGRFIAKDVFHSERNPFGWYITASGC
jgi:hypothetical protein